MAAVARKTFSWFCHEAWSDAIFAGDRLYDHPGDLSVSIAVIRLPSSYLNRAALSAIALISPYSRAWVEVSPFLLILPPRKTYSFKYTGSALGMPALDATPELLTCVVDGIVVILVVKRARDAVSEHALGQGW